MSNKLVGQQREKLLIALQMEEITAAINTALRIRKVTVELDYSEDHFPRLYLSMPGVARIPWMKLDPRKHACYVQPPGHPDLFAVAIDLQERLRKYGARLALTGDKPRHGPRRCLLQVYVDGARTIALTLMDTTRGKRASDTAFQLPDGTTP